METEVGININEERIDNLRFADDIFLFTERKYQLSKQLNKEGNNKRMKMNKKKFMCNEITRKNRRNRILLEEEQLENVEKYKYLEKLLILGNEVEQRNT